MNLDIDQLDKLYESYGFEINRQYNSIRVYLYKKSRYFGCEIIPLCRDSKILKKIEELKKEFSELGFATTIREISEIQEADNELFKSFFSYSSTSIRLKRKYASFIDKQSKSLMGSHYQYIESPFEVFNSLNRPKSVFETISSLFTQSGSDLIIVEASAGYGKTCTAYEVLKLLIDQTEYRTPIFTELARNRGAKIFRYILLDEIDVEFPALNSDLVINEIKKGRIPLIIDGFDELLDKVHLNEGNAEASFNEVESMLDTIGNLLNGRAKILLTTRRTAIFNGIEFDKWYSKWENKFSVTRISIKEPRLKDWLGDKRFLDVKEHNVPIQYVANPVLLTFLKNITEDDFKIIVDNPEILIKIYFDKMLDRERERQNLIITANNQYEIFKNVVKLLMDFDITVESKEFFKELIKDQNSKLLEYTRTLYSGNDKPSIDNLVDSLATHALLDRKGRNENQIGFINDFVLGIFIGDVISDSTKEKIENTYSDYMIDLAVTAYRVQSKHKKHILWKKLFEIEKRLSALKVFLFDIILQEELKRDYENLSVYDFNFYNIDFNSYSIKNSVFLNCIFKRCVFNPVFFENVCFIDCKFDNCTLLDSDFLDSSDVISTIKCSQEGCSLLYKFKNTSHEITHDLYYQKQVLHSLLEISRKSKSKHIMQLLHYFEKPLHKSVSNALMSLEEMSLISVRDNLVTLNINKMTEIKEFTGI